MTEIVHSDMKNDGTVNVYVEKPIDGGFKSAYCSLPEYTWTDICGFTDKDIERYQKNNRIGKAGLTLY